MLWGMAWLRRWTSGETACITRRSIPHCCRFNMRAPAESTSTATGALAQYSTRRMPQSRSAAMPTGTARSSATRYSQTAAPACLSTTIALCSKTWRPWATGRWIRLRGASTDEGLVDHVVLLLRAWGRTPIRPFSFRTPATMGVMRAAKQAASDAAAELAAKLTEALQRERIVPRFVDSYVVEHGRHGLQVHAALYRDLLALLQREALIAASVHAMEIITRDHQPTARSKPRAMAKKEAAAYRRKYLGALARHEKWSVGEALDFQKDFQIYEELMARSASGRRRKPFEAANHPFVDRGAFLLDASFLEKARVAASRALISLEELTEQVVSALK